MSPIAERDPTSNDVETDEPPTGADGSDDVVDRRELRSRYVAVINRIHGWYT